MTECLKSEALERMAEGTGTGTEREHVESCARCQTELQLLISFVAAAPTEAEAPVVRRIEKDLRTAPAWHEEAAPRRRWVFGRPIWGLGLAGLAAMLFIGMWMRNPAVPLGPTEDVVRSGQIDVISPAGDLAVAPDVLRWRPVAGAVAYDVQLADVEARTLWQARATEAVLALPPAARALMTERKTLTWRITALDAQGVAVTAPTNEIFRVVTK